MNGVAKKKPKSPFFDLTQWFYMDLRCIQRAEIRPECSILVLFGSWWGYLGVAMCFPMFPDQFRVIKVVRFEFQPKKSFLGLHAIVNWPNLGGAKKGYQIPTFLDFLSSFPIN